MADTEKTEVLESLSCSNLTYCPVFRIHLNPKSPRSTCPAYRLPKCLIMITLAGLKCVPEIVAVGLAGLLNAPTRPDGLRGV